MAIEVNVWLFNIKQCGYYEAARDRGRPPKFGGVSNCLTDLRAWAYGKRFAETSTFDVPEDSDLQKTYLLAAEKHDSGDWLLGLWNRVHSSSSQIASIGLHEIIGETKTEFTDIGVDRVPGMATYFYFMPAEARVAAIRVKHTTNGLRNFEEYLQSFVGFINPNHVSPIDDKTGIRINGYRENEKSTEFQALFPRFALGPIKKPGDTDYILANRANIRKIVCKTTLTSRHRVERAWWGRALDIIKLGTGSHTLVDEVPIKLDIPFTFTEEELSATLAEWQTRLAGSTSSWDDLGFVMRGEQNPRWLSKSYARQPIELDVQWIDDEQVDATDLLGKLVAKRDLILSAG